MKVKEMISFRVLISALALLAVSIALISNTVAWFSLRMDTNLENVEMVSVGELFSIEPLGDPAHAGIYDDPALDGTNGSFVRDVLLEKAGMSADIITWTITDDQEIKDAGGNKKLVKGKNLGNGPAENRAGGLNPGSCGEIQFIMKPNQMVDAEFTFYLFAYTGGYDEHGDEKKSELELISDGSEKDALIAQKLLNGHILLFTEMDGDGKYSGLITSDADFRRVMTKTYSEQETVSLYWIWPDTLAEIMLDETNSDHAIHLRGKSNICNSVGRTEVIRYFKEHPEWFLLNPEETDCDWSENISVNTTDAAVISLISENYLQYSAYYNEADQQIGTHVAYIMLYMTSDGIGKVSE